MGRRNDAAAEHDYGSVHRLRLELLVGKIPGAWTIAGHRRIRHGIVRAADAVDDERAVSADAELIAFRARGFRERDHHFFGDGVLPGGGLVSGSARNFPMI